MILDKFEPIETDHLKLIQPDEQTNDPEEVRNTPYEAPSFDLKVQPIAFQLDHDPAELVRQREIVSQKARQRCDSGAQVSLGSTA